MDKTRRYRHQGRLLGWKSSEEWSFDSPLPPGTLRTRLEATWDKPFKVFGRGAWTMYRICAVFRRDDSVIVRDFQPMNGESLMTRRRLMKLSGQRFRGKIVPTAMGCRLEGVAEYGNFGRGMAATATLFAVFILFAQITPSDTKGPWPALAGGMLVVAGVQCAILLGSTLRAPRRREAFWLFLDAVTRTPSGEALVDDIDEAVAKKSEAKQGAA